MITLLHTDAGAGEIERAKKAAEAFGDRAVTRLSFDPGNPPDIEAGATVVAFMPDAALAVLLPVAATHGWRLGLLPHPDGRNARTGFGLASTVKEAVEDITGCDEEFQVDLLLCNERVVLNTVVIGDPFTGAMPGGSPEPKPGKPGWHGWISGLTRLVSSVFNAAPMPMKLLTAKERSFDTAALGVLVVEHGRSAVLSRRLLGDAPANDGMLHALVYAPRSVLQMLWFLFISAVLPRKDSDALPAFVGHIRTEGLTVTSPRPVGYTVDGVKDEAKEIVLTVRRQVLTLIPGRGLDVKEGSSEAKETVRMKGLLSSELMDATKARRLPWLYRATPEEFRNLFQQLRESAKASETYVTLMILSTILATFGLFADSTPVIIGAMILAPLMSPIMAMGMGLVRRGERGLLSSSVRSFLIGVGLALGCAVVMTLVTPLRTVNNEIGTRLNPTLLDMGVAVISGVAGAYAHARAEVAKSLAGVAIAVALVPPLAVAGVGIGWWDWGVFSGAGLLFVTNFAGMVLAASATFLVLGYSPYRFSRRGLAGAALATLAVSALLVPGFARMVDKHRVIDSLDGWRTNGVELRSVDLRYGKPVRVSATLLSDGSMDTEDIDRVKRAVSERLGREIVLEATVVLVR